MSDITSELRKQLSETAEEYREDIQNAMKQVLDHLGKTGINALVISGSLVLAYLLYRGISGPDNSKSRKKKNHSEQGVEEDSPVQTMIDRMAEKVLEQSLLFLLSVAKERLIAYLRQTREINEYSEPVEGEK